MALNKPYIQIFNEKLKGYNFECMLEEPTYGEDIIKNNLSQEAYELIMDIVEFLSMNCNSSKTILTMINVVSKVTLKERKEQFLIDKLIQWEDDYPDVKNNILSLL